MQAQTSFAVLFWRQLFACTLIQTGSLVFLLLSSTSLSHAESPSIPWECSNYKANAQTRCLNTLIELQREKIAQLEGQLRTQEGAVSRLKGQVDRQTLVTANLQQRLSDQQKVTISPSFYPIAPFLNFYPIGLGFGIHLGSPWPYTPLHFHGPLWHQPYYGAWWYFR